MQEKRIFPTQLMMSIGVLAAAFCYPLWGWFIFAIHSDLYSHTLLIPLISLYVAGSKWTKSAASFPNHRTLGFLLLAAGAAIAVAYNGAVLTGRSFETQDYLASMIASFVLSLAGVCGVFLEGQTFRSLLFPLGFMGFMIPFPVALERLFDHLLQEGSAVAALGLFKLVGTPVFYTNLVFRLPGIIIEVAPECSGIHSSLVLLILSVLAGFFFLHTPAKRAILVLAILPLAVFRNALRIVTIGELCVRVGPEMIDSDLHRRGGPLFFALSLLPFSTLLWWLWRSDRRTLTQVRLTEE